MMPGHRRRELAAPADAAQCYRRPFRVCTIRDSIANSAQVYGYIIDPGSPMVHVASLRRVEPGPASIKKMHVESGMRQMPGDLIIPTSMTRNAMQKDDACPRGLLAAPNARGEPPAITGRIKLDSRRQ